MSDEEAEAPAIDLGTATDDELWIELRSRYASCMLLYEKALPGKVGENDVASGVLYHATMVERIGLIEMARERIKIDNRRRFAQQDREDED